MSNPSTKSSDQLASADSWSDDRQAVVADVDFPPLVPSAKASKGSSKRKNAWATPCLVALVDGAASSPMRSTQTARVDCPKQQAVAPECGTTDGASSANSSSSTAGESDLIKAEQQCAESPSCASGKLAASEKGRAISTGSPKRGLLTLDQQYPPLLGSRLSALLKAKPPQGPTQGKAKKKGMPSTSVEQVNGVEPLQRLQEDSPPPSPQKQTDHSSDKVAKKTSLLTTTNAVGDNSRSSCAKSAENVTVPSPIVQPMSAAGERDRISSEVFDVDAATSSPDASPKQRSTGVSMADDEAQNSSPKRSLRRHRNFWSVDSVADTEADTDAAESVFRSETNYSESVASSVEHADTEIVAEASSDCAALSAGRDDPQSSTPPHSEAELSHPQESDEVVETLVVSPNSWAAQRRRRQRGHLSSSVSETNSTPQRGKADREAGNIEVSASSWAAEQLRRRQLRASGAQEQHPAEIARRIRAILNKLTVEKFGTLLPQLTSCGIETCEHVEILMREVMEKALAQHHFIPMYTDLCLSLDNWCAEKFSDLPATRGFKHILVNECQRSFQLFLNPPEHQANLEGADRDELVEAELKLKAKRLGNIRFVGALVSNAVLSGKIALSIAQQLLADPVSPDSLETLAAFLTAIGGACDKPTWRQHEALKVVFARLEELSRDVSRVPARIRFLLADLLDLRAAGWQDQKKATTSVRGPTTLQEVRRHAAFEAGYARRK